VGGTKCPSRSSSSIAPLPERVGIPRHERTPQSKREVDRFSASRTHLTVWHERRSQQDEGPQGDFMRRQICGRPRKSSSVCYSGAAALGVHVSSPNAISRVGRAAWPPRSTFWSAGLPLRGIPQQIAKTEHTAPKNSDGCSTITVTESRRPDAFRIARRVIRRVEVALAIEEVYGVVRASHAVAGGEPASANRFLPAGRPPGTRSRSLCRHTRQKTHERTSRFVEQRAWRRLDDPRQMISGSTRERDRARGGGGGI